ncbi:MAG: EamA family transporter RarD [Paracoccaceae bacterium]
MSETTKGVLAMIVACVVWGLSPIYYKLIAHVPPLEVLSHRTLWSLVLFGAIIVWQLRLGDLFSLVTNARSLAFVAIAAVVISVNWFVYIYAIQIGRTIESSLGYYIFPLVAVLFGMTVFGERLTFWRWISVSIATFAVITLTLGLGVTPWISLILAITFGLYLVIKKWTGFGPVVSVTAEVLLLMPVALLWLWGVHFKGWTGITGQVGGVFGTNLTDSLILMLSGPLTAGPLILFSYAARRVSLATIGLVQYLNPTLQFLCAVALFGEPFTVWHTIAFALIWLALAIYSIDALRQEKQDRKALARAASSSASVR